MAIIFTVPDISEPLFDRSSGLLTDIWYRFFEEFERQMHETVTNVGGQDDNITLLLDFKTHTEADLDAIRKRSADQANVTFTASLGLVGGGSLQDAINNGTAIDISLPAGARGSVLYKGATNWQVLAPGAASTVLTAGGAGVDPAWVAPSGGGGSVGPRQGSVTKPLIADYTAVNHQASTVGVNGVAGIMLTDTVATAANFRFLELTAALPATPFDVYAHFGFAPNGSQAGLTLRSTTTSKFIMMGKFQNDFIITVWNSPTSFAGNRLLPAVWQDVSWFRFNVSATIILCYASYNGLDWFLMFSETIASFLTGPMNKVGFAIQTDTVPVGLLCDSFSFVAPT
jgi:hypothetical protein